MAAEWAGVWVPLRWLEVACLRTKPVRYAEGGLLEMLSPWITCQLTISSASYVHNPLPKDTVWD